MVPAAKHYQLQSYLLKLDNVMEQGIYRLDFQFKLTKAFHSQGLL